MEHLDSLRCLEERARRAQAPLGPSLCLAALAAHLEMPKTLHSTLSVEHLEYVHMVGGCAFPDHHSSCPTHSLVITQPAVIFQAQVMRVKACSTGLFSFLVPTATSPIQYSPKKTWSPFPNLRHPYLIPRPGLDLATSRVSVQNNSAHSSNPDLPCRNAIHTE